MNREINTTFRCRKCHRFLHMREYEQAELCRHCFSAVFAQEQQREARRASFLLATVLTLILVVILAGILAASPASTSVLAAPTPTTYYRVTWWCFAVGCCSGNSSWFDELRTAERLQGWVDETHEGHRSYGSRIEQKQGEAK